MEIWIRLGEDASIEYVEINTNGSSKEEGAFLYNLTINQINSIVLFKSRLVSDSGKYTIDNSKDYNATYKTNEELAKKKEAMKLELNGLYEWFSTYDIQVNEYNRDIVIGLPTDIHIGEETYATINALYEKANTNAKRIAEIKEALK